VSGLLQDIRYAGRQLRANPAFAGFAVMTLALGIGANSAIFTLVNAVLLQSIPVRNPDQLVVPRWSARTAPQNVGISSFGDCATQTDSGPETEGCSFSYPLFKSVRSLNLFSSIAAFAGPVQFALSDNGPATMAQGELVSGEFFQTLGQFAELGRTIQTSDEQPGASPVLVLSYSFWQNAFGGAPGAIGRTIRLNSLAFTIVGVSQASFTRLTPGQRVDFWLPLTHAGALGLPWAGRSNDVRNLWLTLVARVKPGQSASQTQAQMTSLYRNDMLYEDKPAFKESDDPMVRLLPAEKALVGIRSDLGEPLSLAMTAVAVVLLIMCANLAGLMLARAISREKELAVRMALGSSRRRVVEQLLTESVLLSLTGAAMGVLLAVGGAKGLAEFVSSRYRSAPNLNLHPDVRVIAFTSAVAVLTGIIFGLAPALRGAGIAVAPRLKESSTRGFSSSRSGPRRFPPGSWLVVSQVALSMVVLIAAGLLLRTLEKLRSIDPGFDTRNILLFSVDPELAGYKAEQVNQVCQEIEQKLAALPGVSSVTYSSAALLDGSSWTAGLKIEGQQEKREDTQMLAVGPGYFKTMRIPLLQGRELREPDMSSTGQVAVVDRSFVEKLLESRSPLDSHFELDDQKYEIVGVVADTKYDRLTRHTAPTAYIPLKKGQATFALRSEIVPSAMVPDVRRVVNEIDENLPVFQVRTQSQAVDRLLFNQRLVAGLFSMFGALVLLLCCIGLYGLLSYDVVRRKIEIGIRTALGAERGDVLNLVIRQGLLLVFAGLFGGITLAFVLTRYLRSILFDIQPMDLGAILGASLVLSIVALLACYIPARAAAKVDPMVALRYE
jgi:predicted permease